MSDNPFAEPEDNDRTVFRPMPGGPRNAARAPLQAPPPPPAAPPPIAPGADLAALAAAASSPLAAAAAPLLQLLARLRNTATPPDQGDMRDRTVRELRDFEKRARDAGVPMEQLRPAHYALCASLDDAVLNTPWGAHGRWSQRTLAGTFHQDQQAGQGFFDQLRQMRHDPATHRPVLELMYICLSLGFMGPYRATPDGQDRIDRIREQTFALVAGQLPPAPPTLAQHWKGVDAPYRPKRVRVPVWVGLCAALAVVAGGFVWALNGLNAGSDDVYAGLLAAPPSTMPRIARAPFVQPPPPPEPPPPGPADRLRAALAAEIAQHAITVVASPSATTLRIPAAKLFPQPNATPAPAAAPLLDRVGQALKAEPGPLRVIGYTDNQPSRTVGFPSNFALSQARAQAVRAALAKPLGDAARIAA